MSNMKISEFESARKGNAPLFQTMEEAVTAQADKIGDEDQPEPHETVFIKVEPNDLEEYAEEDGELVSVKTEPVVEIDIEDHNPEVDALPKQLKVRPLVECKVCGKVVVHMRLHMKMHADKAHMCDVCGASFRWRYKLKDHLASHLPQKPVRCDPCDKSFPFEEYLAKHLNHAHVESKTLDNKGAPDIRIRSHTGERRHQCNLCGSLFVAMNNLTIHMRRAHSAERPFKCDQCSSAFAVNSELKVHLRIHTGEKPYKCEVCDRAFAQRNTLKCHRMMHTGERPFLCTVCGKAFAQSGMLRIHARRHTGETPYHCDYCGDSFVDRNAILIHMRRAHTGERPFQCKHCDSAFVVNSELKVHARTHTGEKPFKCEECGRAFAQKTSLKYHRQTHTAEMLWGSLVESHQ